MEQTMEQERKNMDSMMKEERDDMDRRMQFQRVNHDIRLLQELQAWEQIIKKHRADMEAALKQGRAKMDQKLKEEREEMDHIIQLERAKTDTIIMQLRADREEMLQDEHELPSNAPANEKAVVMELTIHFGWEICYKPKGYKEGQMRMKRYVEPDTVEWSELLYQLSVDFGYKEDSVLYYLQPGMEVPDGLILMRGPQDLQRLMQAHEGTKLCHLFLENNDSSSSESDTMIFAQDDESVDSHSKISDGKLKRKRDSWDCCDNEERLTEPMEQHHVEAQQQQDVAAVEGHGERDAR